MAIIFAEDDKGTFILREGLFRLVLARARQAVSSDADRDELQDYREGISLFRMSPDDRARLGGALLSGAESLRVDIVTGRPTDEPIREGAAEYLTELIEFLSRHLSDRREASPGNE